jgi:Uma2 family endonuclease
MLTTNPQQFYQLCQDNPDIKYERNAQEEIIIMPPTGGETGRKNSYLIMKVGVWNEEKQLGVCFDSSTCFRLPVGSDRSPDVAWIQLERWESLSQEEREKFPPIAPDFVLELMSPTDNLKTLEEKMLEYLESGVRLAWLIYPKMQLVEIYRQGQEKEVLIKPNYLSGEDVLRDFVLDLSLIWG